MNEEFFVCLKFSVPGFFELEKFYMGALFKQGIALKCGCRVPRAFAGRPLTSRLKDGGKLNLSTQRVNVDGKRETSTENLPVLVFP